MRSSSFRFYIVDLPLCLSCGLEETPNHIFWVCPLYSLYRKGLQLGLVSSRGFLPHPVEYLLATLRG